MSCFTQNETLYIILPYFNFCNFKRRRELFCHFVETIRRTPQVRIVVSEALSKGTEALPKLPVFKHIRTQTDSHIWLKENLINIATRRLPSSWKYVAWIDADIDFLNQNWLHETLEELKTADVVQLFRSAVNLGPNGETIKVDKGFAYMAKGSGTPWTSTDKYGFWHPGYAWACTRRAYKKMGGLVDWAILGSGDRHMAMALDGRVMQSAPGNIHSNYKVMLQDYENNCKGLKLSWVDGTIVHHWHGNFADRRYKERWEILTRNNFDPLEDIGVTDRGLIQLTKSGRRFERFLDEYFLGRREDLP